MPGFPEGSIDLVLTDPPYGLSQKSIKGDESFEAYEKSLPLIHRILKEDKWFITFAPIGAVHKIIELTEPFFEYSWLGFIYYRNRQKFTHCPIGKTKISLFVCFKKGNPKRNQFMPDVLEFLYDRYDQKPLHPASKPLKPIISIIKFASKLGDTILDPFCGSGTTCMGAKISNRDYIGIEIDPKYAGVAKIRVETGSKNLKRVFNRD